MTFKYLLLTSNSTYRSDLRGRTHRRLLRLSNRLMGYERTCASQGNLHAVPRQWWWMGKYRPLSPRWDHYSTMVFSWSRRWCSHVRRAQRCLACPPISYDVGFGVQCNAWVDHTHHILFLSRSRLAKYCAGTEYTDTQTGIPIIQVPYDSTNSIGGTTFMTTLLILPSLVGMITTVAASSRQVWAFARDKGLPTLNT